MTLSCVQVRVLRCHARTAVLAMTRLSVNSCASVPQILLALHAIKVSCTRVSLLEICARFMVEYSCACTCIHVHVQNTAYMYMHIYMYMYIKMYVSYSCIKIWIGFYLNRLYRAVCLSGLLPASRG